MNNPGCSKRIFRRKSTRNLRRNPSEIREGTSGITPGRISGGVPEGIPWIKHVEGSQKHILEDYRRHSLRNLRKTGSLEKLQEESIKNTRNSWRISKRHLEGILWGSWKETSGRIREDMSEEASEVVHKNSEGTSGKVLEESPQVISKITIWKPSKYYYVECFDIQNRFKCLTNWLRFKFRHVAYVLRWESTPWLCIW